jgi:hypothetical protein
MFIIYILEFINNIWYNGKAIIKEVDNVGFQYDNELPAKQSLELENILVMSNLRADTQDIDRLK